MALCASRATRVPDHQAHCIFRITHEGKVLTNEAAQVGVKGNRQHATQELDRPLITGGIACSPSCQSRNARTSNLDVTPLSTVHTACPLNSAQSWSLDLRAAEKGESTASHASLVDATLNVSDCPLVKAP
eukprot:scaffold42551_cov16-Tisochrysis_lutea.AAC.1